MRPARGSAAPAAGPPKTLSALLGATLCTAAVWTGTAVFPDVAGHLHVTWRPPAAPAYFGVVEVPAAAALLVPTRSPLPRPPPPGPALPWPPLAAPSTPPPRPRLPGAAAGAVLGLCAVLGATLGGHLGGKWAGAATPAVHRWPGEVSPLAASQTASNDTFNQPALLRPLLLFLIAQALLYISSGGVAPGLPLYAKTLGLGPTALGLLLAAPSLSAIPLNAASGRVADTRGRRPLLIGGMLCIAVGCALTGAFAGFGPQSAFRITFSVPAISFLVLLGARLVLGAGRSATETAEQALLADLCATAPAAKGRILAATRVVMGIGMVGGPLVGALATEHWGPGAPFYCVGVAGAVGALLYALWLPETKAKARLGPPGQPPVYSPHSSADDALLGDPSAPPSQRSGSSWGVWWGLLRLRRQRALVAAVAAQTLGQVAQAVLLPLLMAGPRFGASARDIGVTFSLVESLGLGGALLCGWLLDAGLGYAPLVGGAGVACALGLTAAALAGSVKALVLAFGLWGAGAGVLGPALQGFAQSLAPQGQKGVALALPKTVTDVTILLGALGIGQVAEVAGLGGALMACGCAAALAALYFLVQTRASGPTETPRQAGASA